MSRGTAILQSAFVGGELGPELHGRVDMAKYRVGAVTLRNFFVRTTGGAVNRPGTAAVGRCKQAYGTKPRNIGFQFNAQQTYMLEFGQQYMRVIMDGGYVLEPALTLVDVAVGLPAQFTVTASGFAVGDQLFVTGATGMTNLNSTTGFQLLVSAILTADTFYCTDLDGMPIDSSTWAAYTASSGTIARLFTMVTPYNATDLPLVKYAQDADTLTLTHPSYQSATITRTSHSAWTYTLETFAAEVQKPTGGTATKVGSAATTLTYYYRVTSATDDPYEESVASTIFSQSCAALNQDTGINMALTWVAPASGPAPDRYYVYRARPVVTGQPTPSSFGYIGESTALTFTDTNIAPQFDETPPTAKDPFASSNYPGCVTYFQSRKWYAAPTAYPQTLYGTQVGRYNNMDVHSPLRDDDAITVGLSSRQLNAIKHLIEANDLLALTSNGAWKIESSDNSALKPSTINAHPQAYNGCSDVPPLQIGDEILYVQALGGKVRSLAYSFNTNLFTGEDLTVLAPHLFEGYDIQEWMYTEEPNYQTLAVRSDGQMLAFTYLKEQEVYAWTHYDTPGNSLTDLYVSVASIPEDDENVAYMITKRTIPGVNGGNPVYMQERQASRRIRTLGVVDFARCWFVDCGARYQGAAVTTVSGLEHLNGATVSVLADGNVVLGKVITNGTLTLDTAASIIIVGLPYESDLQTLRLDSPEMVLLGKRMKISRFSLVTRDTRGLEIAAMRENSAGEPVVGQYTEIKDRASSISIAATAPLRSGVDSLLLDPSWSVSGQVYIRQLNPLPATILAIAPTVLAGDDAG